MNSKEIKRLAKIHVWPYLKESGYNVINSNVSEYEFTKDLDGGRSLVCTGGTYTRPNGTAVTSPSYYILVPKFNAVINHYFEKFNVDNVENSRFCDAWSIGRKHELSSFMSNVGIASKEEFMIWLDYFKNFMTEIVEPFIVTCSTMAGLNQLVETRQNNEDLMISLGTTNAWMKKIFILKVAKNPAFTEYSKWFLDLYTKIHKEEGPAWENHCNACFALYEDLEKGVWDDFKL